MEQESTSLKTLTNTAYSFVGYTLPIIFSIAITPVIVRKLGVVDFGVYVLLNTINGFLGLLDLGIGLSLIKYASEYKAKGEYGKLNGLIGSINLLFLMFGFFGMMVYFVLGRYLLPVFHISASQQQHILPVFMMAGLVFLAGSLSAVPAGLLKAWQRYDLSVKTALLHLTVFNLASLILVLSGFKLKAIFLANCLLVVVFWLVYSAVAKRISGLRIWHYDWNPSEVKRCYRFGLAAFVTNISNNTLAQLDRLFIPIYLSPAQLSYYGLPGNVAEKINGATGSSTGVLFPMLSSLTASGGTEQIKKIYARIFRNIAVLVAAMALSIALFSQKILFYWLGADFAEKGTKILIILALTNAVLALYSVLQNFLLGFGKVRFLMKSSIFMALLNVAALFVLVPRFQIQGAAWAYLISVAPVIFVFFWVEKKFLQLPGRLSHYLKLFGKLGLVALVLTGLFLLVLNSLVTSLWSLLLVGGFSVLLYLALYWLFGFVDEEDLELYKGFFKSMKLKIGF